MANVWTNTVLTFIEFFDLFLQQSRRKSGNRISAFFVVVDRQKGLQEVFDPGFRIILAICILVKRVFPIHLATGKPVRRYEDLRGCGITKDAAASLGRNLTSSIALFGDRWTSSVS